MMRKAGLAETGLKLSVAGALAGHSLIDPPASFAAVTIYAQARTLLAGGGVAAAGAGAGAAVSGGASSAAGTVGTSLGKLVAGGTVVKTKLALVGAIVALGLAGIFGPKLLQDSKEKLPAQLVVSKQISLNSESSNIQEIPSPQLTGVDSGMAELSVRVVWKGSKAPIAGTSVTLVMRSGSEEDRTKDGPGKSDSQMTDFKGLAVLQYPRTWNKVKLSALGPSTSRAVRYLTLPLNKQPYVLPMTKGYTAYGKVLRPDDDGKLLPVAGARVWVWSGKFPVTISGADGSWELNAISSKEATLDARKGHQRCVVTAADQVKIKFAPDIRNGPYDLVLKPALSLVGVVTAKKTGEPISGASVKIQIDSEYSEETDESGLFTFECLPWGTWQTTAHAKGFVDDTHLIQISPEKDNLTLFELEAGGELLLRVVDKDGVPLENVNTYLDRNRMGGPPVRTNKEGTVTYQGVSFTTRQYIAAIKDGYEHISRVPVEMDPSKRKTELTLVLMPQVLTEEDLRKGVFTGKVSNADGDPLANIKILWSSGWDALAERGLKTKTGEDGIYYLEVTKERNWRELYAYGEGLAPAIKRGFTPGTIENPTEVNFILKEGHWVAGTVVDEDDNPIEGVQIDASIPGFIVYDFEGFPGSKKPKTNAEGYFWIENLHGPDVSLELTAQGMTPIAREIVPVDKEARIVMERTGIILGKVIDKESKEPIADFTVKIKSTDRNSLSRRKEQKVYDTNGLFTLEDLAKGIPFEVTVESRFRTPATLTDIEAKDAGEAKDQLFELSETKKLVGEILDGATEKPLEDIPLTYANLTRPGSSFDLFWKDLGNRSNLENTQRLTTDEAGSFSLDEAETPGVLFIRTKGYAPCIIFPEKRELYTEQDSEKLRILLGKGASVSGVYFTEGKSKPEERASLYMLNNAYFKGSQNFEDQKLGPDGDYRWEDLGEGDYKLSIYFQVQHEANSILTKRFHLKKGEGKTVNLNNDMGSAVLFGRVLDGQKPVWQTRIALTPNFEWEYTLFSNYTDKDGNYRIEGLKPGAYRLRPSKATSQGSAYPQPREITIQIGEGETRHDFQMRRGNQITARLKFPESMPEEFRLRKASASLYLSDGPRGKDNPDAPDTYASTQVVMGRMSFQGSLKGNYSLSISWQGNGQNKMSYKATQTFNINSFDMEQDLGDVEIPPLGRSKFSGRILDEKGQGVRAGFRLTPEFSSGYTHTIISDDNGQYLRENLLDGIYIAEIHFPNPNGPRKDPILEKIEIRGNTTHDFAMQPVSKVKEP